MSKRHALSLLLRPLTPAISKVVRVLLAVVLIVVLAWFIDLRSVWMQLRQTDWRWLALALLVVQLQIVLSAWRWKITASRLGQDLTGRRAIGEYYLATFANLSLPGGVTGDAIRVYRNRQPDALGVSVHGVVLERLSGQFALLLVGIVGWLLWPLLMHGSMPQLGVRLIGMAIIVLVLVFVVLRLLIRFAPDWLTRKVLDLGEAAYLVWWADRQWLVQGVLSVSVVLSYLLVFWFSSYAVNAPLPIASVLTLVPLVLLSMLIPLSIGGWGIREAAAAILWPVAALTAEAGVVTSIVYALISWLGCLPGLLLVFAFRYDQNNINKLPRG